MQDRPKVLVGKTVVVRLSYPEPSYYTDVHRRWIGQAGVVHAIVTAQPRENPLVKVKFGPDDQVVFFRRSDLDIVPPPPPETRAST